MDETTMETLAKIREDIAAIKAQLEKTDSIESQVKSHETRLTILETKTESSWAMLSKVALVLFNLATLAVAIIAIANK